MALLKDLPDRHLDALFAEHALGKTVKYLQTGRGYRYDREYKWLSNFISGDDYYEMTNPGVEPYDTGYDRVNKVVAHYTTSMSTALAAAEPLADRGYWFRFRVAGDCGSVVVLAFEDKAAADGASGRTYPMARPAATAIGESSQLARLFVIAVLEALGVEAPEQKEVAT